MNTKTARVAALCMVWTLTGATAVEQGQLVDSLQPTPGSLLRRHIEAAGGREKLESIKSGVWRLDAKEGNESFQLVVTFQGAQKLHLLASMPNGFEVKQAHDEKGRWWRQDPNGVREFEETTHERDFCEMALCLNPVSLLHFEDSVSKLKVAGEEKVDELNCRVVEATLRHGASMKLWFDSVSGLLVKAGDSLLQDYRTEDGVMVAHTIRKGSGSLLKLKSVTLNPPVKDELFTKPDGPNSTGGGNFGQPEFATNLNPGTHLGLVRQPVAADFGRGTMTSMPKHRVENQSPFQVDLRGVDVSQIDLAGRLSDLQHADFDSKTVWPARLPEGFKPEVILETAKNPGLRVRALHRRGITGKGIGIGIIDQTLLVNHCEYKDRLKTYEEIHSPAGAPAQMHGPAVASIAVGRTVGVAPEADLYYIAEMHGTIVQGKFDWDFTWLAKSIDRLLEINTTLPKENRIRVISVSVGWGPGQKGCEETDAAVQRATQAGVFVISTALERTHKLAFHGLGRPALKDPDQESSYGLGSWWANNFLNGRFRFAPGQRLLVPMDSRTTASPTGEDDYVFYPAGGWSWSVPYLAGLYALACQVDRDVTPETFWAAALNTGHIIPLEHEGQKIELGTIAAPVALIERLQEGTKGKDDQAAK